MDLHHPLLSEFPEFADTIQMLKSQDGHFRELFDEYHQIDDRVCRMEEELDRTDYCALETLKMRRVLLKDVLFHEMRVASPPQMALH